APSAIAVMRIGIGVSNPRWRSSARAAVKARAMELCNKAPALCLWRFVLLSINGARILPLPLVERRAMLTELIASADDEHLRFSGDFSDPIKLLKTYQRMNLEA